MLPMEQYRTASNRATELSNANAILTSELAVAQSKASEQVLELKRTHMNNAYTQLERKLQDSEYQRQNLERIIAQKDEENSRLKQQRSGYGTRGSPQIRGPNSRAASPALGTRDRVAQIRHG
jgi:septal ring factor EnvC (AmiA/AmiB activator)